VARCHRACLQHDEYRPEHPFGYVLRHHPRQAQNQPSQTGE
jgi:hypothetical protein